MSNQPGEAAEFGHLLAEACEHRALLEVSICQREGMFAIAVDEPAEARAALGDQVIG